MSITSKLNSIYLRIFNCKYWHNISQFCNGKTHPGYGVIKYRPYRRGKNRCLACGSKIGKIKCERYAYKDKLIDNIFEENTFLKLLRNKSGKD